MTERHKIHHQGLSSIDSVILSAIRDTAMEWQTELYFLQNKSSLLKEIAMLSTFSKRCTSTDGNVFKEEFSKLSGQVFTSFHKKLLTWLEELDSTNFYPIDASESSINYYRELHKDWQNLKKQYRQTELQILDGVIKNYPAIIF
ncbi:MAG: hypothetical protein CMN32_06395 [Saprospirales bacterium]|nr:hypothetical protein [Saprospirales bacterium]